MYDSAITPLYLPNDSRRMTRRRRRTESLEDRFEFSEDALAPGDRVALRPALFEVRDSSTGLERTLKLWRKTGNPVDDDLRNLWLHEMRQVQRVMAYAGARDVVADVLEFVEDDNNFGVVLERIGQPRSERRRRVSRQHWLRNLAGPRPRGAALPEPSAHCYCPMRPADHSLHRCSSATTQRTDSCAMQVVSAPALPCLNSNAWRHC